MSDLLERYLQAVGRALPTEGKEDTLAELRANLLAEMDDKAELLGRATTEEEEATILVRHGHPNLVAARYRPQQSLIGPELFPIYWSVLRRTLPIVVLVVVVVRAVMVIYGPPQPLIVVNSILRLMEVLFYFFAWVTLLFAGVEIFKAKFPQKVNLYAEWDPRKLAKVEPASGQDLPKNPVADLVVTAIFNVVWLLFPYYHPYVGTSQDTVSLQGVSIQLAPVWHQFYLAVVAVNLVQLVFKIVALRSSAQRWRKPMKLVEQVLGLAPTLVLLQVQQYLAFAGSVPDPLRQRFTVVLNAGIHRLAELVLVVMGCLIAWHGVALLLRLRAGAGRVQGVARKA